MRLLKSVLLKAKGDKGCFPTRKFNCNIKCFAPFHYIPLQKVLENMGWCFK